MTLHQLRIFSAVAKHLNISQAAMALHISQPSVSEQLKLLEEECRVKLYKSTGHGIELTTEGRLFLKEVRPILFQVEELKRKFFLNRPDSKTGYLRVGGSYGPSAIFIPLVAAAFKGAHPEAQIALRTDNSLAMERLVQNSDVELAVTTASFGSPYLVYEPCRQEELVFIASTKHPIARRNPVTVAELAQVALVIFRRGRLGGIAGILNQVEERGFHPNIVMYCESPEALKTAVKTGMGVGTTYKDMVEHDVRRGELKVIDVPELNMRVDSFIIYHKEKPLSADAKDFLALLREWAKGTKKDGPKALCKLFGSMLHRKRTLASSERYLSVSSSSDPKTSKI